MVKDEIERAFSYGANNYDKYAVVQNTVANKLANIILDKAKIDNKNIIEIGCGTGFLTEKVLTNSSVTSYLANDISFDMLKKLKSKNLPCSINYLCQDAENLYLNAKYDYLISSLCFQWFSNIERSLANLSSYAKEMFFSVLIDGTFQEWVYACNKVNKTSGVNQFISKNMLLNHIELMNPQYYELIEAEEVQNYTNPIQFLKEIKLIGANVSMYNYQNQFIRPILNAFSHYNKITYKILYCHIKI
jgi:malonyl-CoA O-methyltransferase